MNVDIKLSNINKFILTFANGYDILYLHLRAGNASDMDTDLKLHMAPPLWGC